jgi:hypothetical protein
MPHWSVTDEPAAPEPVEAAPPPAEPAQLPPIERIAEIFERLFLTEPELTTELLGELGRCNTGPGETGVPPSERPPVAFLEFDDCIAAVRLAETSTVRLSSSLYVSILVKEMNSNRSETISMVLARHTPPAHACGLALIECPSAFMTD